MTIKVKDEVSDIDAKPETATVTIRNSERELLRLTTRGGTITATYDESDLDEAAQIFVREIVRISSQTLRAGANVA